MKKVDSELYRRKSNWTADCRLPTADCRLPIVAQLCIEQLQAITTDGVQG